MTTINVTRYFIYACFNAVFIVGRIAKIPGLRACDLSQNEQLLSRKRFLSCVLVFISM